MKKMKLSDFATLQSGLVLNRKEARSEEETAKYYKRINMRSLSEYGELDRNDLDIFPSVEILDSAVLTQPNDIIVKLFTPICPTLISEKDKGFIIPSQLVVIRVFDDQVLPEYLRYYLSAPEVSDLMLSIEGWRSQRTIKVSTFADLEIPIPSIEKQQLIAKISAINSKREQLYKELIEEEKKLTTLKLQKYIGGKV
jgi:restriction endonuclease S subunit